MITYEIINNNIARVYGGGIDIFYDSNRAGNKFQSYADAEAFALAKVSEINKDRAGIQNIFFHIDLSGGDGRNDPIGVANDGVDKLHVRCVAKATQEPTSAAITAIPDKSWRILLRHIDKTEYETITVAMSAGVIEFDYYTSNPKTGLVYVDESALDEIFEIGGYNYKIKLVGDIQFKVSRNL